MQLIKRQGNNRTYTSDKGLIEVVVCADRNLYVNPGYYVRASMSVPSEILSKSYRSAKDAAKACYNAMV